MSYSGSYRSAQELSNSFLGPTCMTGNCKEVVCDGMPMDPVANPNWYSKHGGLGGCGKNNTISYISVGYPGPQDKKAPSKEGYIPIRTPSKEGYIPTSYLPVILYANGCFCK